MNALNDSSLSLAFANTSLFPNPAALPTMSGNASLPKIVTLSIGADDMEGLVYAETDASTRTSWSSKPCAMTPISPSPSCSGPDVLPIAPRASRSTGTLP